MLAPEIDASTLMGVSGRIARCQGNIERIVRLAAYPVHSYEFTVAGGNLDLLRRALADEAVHRQVDVAVQVDGLHRRAKHLIVLDADSTLLQGEAIDLLAEQCGLGGHVAAVTARAMAGEIDFEQALRQRVRAHGRSRPVGARRRAPRSSFSRRAPARWSARSSGSATRRRW